MAGGVSLGQVLQVISGVPLRKVATAKFENLHLPKRLEGGGGGGALRQVLLDGNLSSMMSNPMGAITGQLQGQIGQAVQQLQSASGIDVGAAVQALTGNGGLASAVLRFQAAGDNLAGITNAGAGFAAVQGHEQFVAMLGDAVPAHLSLDAVAGPHEAEGLIRGVSQALSTAVAQVANGTMTVPAFVVWALASAGSIDAVTLASATALAEGQARMVVVSQVSSIAGSLMTYPGDGGPSRFQGMLRRMVQPDTLAAMDAAAEADRRAAREAAERARARDIAKITSLED